MRREIPGRRRLAALVWTIYASPATEARCSFAATRLCGRTGKQLLVLELCRLEHIFHNPPSYLIAQLLAGIAGEAEVQPTVHP